MTKKISGIESISQCDRSMRSTRLMKVHGVNERLMRG